MCHCGLKSSERIWKQTSIMFFLARLSLLAYVLYKRRGMVTVHYIKNHDTQTEIGKFIYEALTLHGKDFLLKRDQLQSHKSVIYFQKCLPGKNMLKLLSHS